MWGTGHRKWTLWHPVALDCTSGLLVDSFEKAADAAPEGRGCSRRPKWRASIKRTVRGHVVFSEQRSGNSTKSTDFSKRLFCLDCQGFSLWKKDKVDFFKRNAFFKRLWNKTTLFLSHYSFSATTCLTWFCVKNDVFIANIRAWVPWAVEKKNLSTFIMICRVFSVYFLVN